ncbi:MAG: glucuronate isomerase [Eubacterium sp.]|nr:glucuronate isomerase [Eubacterium sp.]
MKKNFMDQDFLLETETAKKLYHETAEKQPIIDYHCHLDPREIYEDKPYTNLTEIWLYGDHYKWRLMRSAGIPEKYITGDADDKEKFLKWAEALEGAIGNPLYHWSHLELQRYFGIQDHLTRKNAEEIWEKSKEILKKGEISPRNLIRKSNVKALCTTDDPKDTLEWHKKIRELPEGTFGTKVLPAWRPDRVLGITAEDFSEYIRELGASDESEITTFGDLKKALADRVSYFAANGCCVSDHGLAKIVFHPVSEEEADRIFQKGLRKEKLTDEEIYAYQTEVLLFLGHEYAQNGWVMQLHLGVQRNLNHRLYKSFGPDAGCDAVGDQISYVELGKYLGALDEDGALPKTILYSLNAGDNEALGTLIGCFQDDSARGKIQHGAAWWFNDTKRGMEEQLISLANLGLLRNAVGMLTDSRSFLSYARHEYFRRILCNLIGKWVENGEYPDDEKLLTDIVTGICYKNAEAYFNFGK